MCQQSTDYRGERSSRWILSCVTAANLNVQPLPPHIYNHHRHSIKVEPQAPPPPHSASCNMHISKCVRAPRKNTTSASCSGQWPPWVQVEYGCWEARVKVLDYFLDQLCEGVLCSLLRRHQTSDKTVCGRPTDAQEYCTLLLCAINVIGHEVVFQLLRVSYPLFWTVVKLSHVPESCHLIPASLPLCRRGLLWNCQRGTRRILTERRWWKGDANEHAPHWTTRQDKNNQQQTLQHEQWIIELQFTQHTIHYSNGKQEYTSLQSSLSSVFGSIICSKEHLSG